MLYDLACSYESASTLAWTCKESSPVTTVVQYPSFRIVNHGVLDTGQWVTFFLALVIVMAGMFAVGYAQGRNPRHEQR